MKRYLIITADDFGFSKERNQGIVEAIQHASVKSASLLLNCTGTNEAIQLIKEHKIFAGLHLNLTEGHPIHQDGYSTLTNPNGEFWGKFGLRKQLEDGKLDLLEIRHEIQCQIKQFTKLVGREPPYVDGHQHVHVHPAIADIFASTLAEYGIAATRFPVEVSMDYKNWVHASSLAFYKEVMDHSWGCKTIFDLNSIRYSDAYVGYSTMGSNMTASRLQSAVLEGFIAAEKLHGSDKSKTFVTCELMTHPGYATGKDSGGFNGHSDAFGCSQDREHEIQVLRSKEMLNFYEQNNIQLVSHEILLSDGSND